MKLANVLRAAVILLRHARQHTRKHAKRVRGLVHPSNSDALALAVFEHRLAEAELRAAPNGYLRLMALKH